MQFLSWCGEPVIGLFQSSSSPKAGCNAGAIRETYRDMYVSILIQPEGWMQLPTHSISRMVLRVSILIQPEGWMQYRSICGTKNRRSFNPHPARRLDAIKYPQPQLIPATSFNPHPARRLDAMYDQLANINGELVSILIQPEGWMQ